MELLLSLTATEPVVVKDRNDAEDVTVAEPPADDVNVSPPLWREVPLACVTDALLVLN